MGISLTIGDHASPPVALGDTATAYKLKVPIKGGKKTELRLILKVAPIPTLGDAGVTHPAELAGWLLEKCGAQYVGAMCAWHPKCGCGLVGNSTRCTFAESILLRTYSTLREGACIF